MKKIMYSMLIIFIIIFNINTKAFKAKNIDLKIKDNEVSVVFIKLEGSTSLLINDENDSNLFIINYKNDENLKNAVSFSTIKALCLHVAHDCNLRCKYCFASTGDFGGNRELVSIETAKKAIDFLIKNWKQKCFIHF